METTNETSKGDKVKIRLAVLLLVFAFGCFAQDQQKKEKAPRVTKTATLTWSAPTTCTDNSTCTATGYNVYRASVACPASGLPTGATKLNSTPITTTTYTDTITTSTSVTYCYYTTALNSAGESKGSNTGSLTVSQAVVSPPTNFKVTIQ